MMLMASTMVAGVPPAAAQSQDATDVITVEAPRSVPVPVERNAYSGSAVAVTTVKMSVLYGDLDLSAQKDVERLMLRVRHVAREACKALDRLYPLDPDETCTDKAVANATPLAFAVIEAARGR